MHLRSGPGGRPGRSAIGACSRCNGGGCLALGALEAQAHGAPGPAYVQQGFAAGAELSRGDAAAPTIAVVAAGAVRTEWCLTDGRRQVLDFHLKGEVMPAPCQPPAVRAVAVSDGVLYRLDAAAYADCRTRCRELMAWTAALAQRQQERLTRRVLLLGRLTARERLGVFLLDLAERIGTAVAGGIAISLPMGREDIADHLGLNTETVSRQLGALKTAGLLRLPKPCEVVLPDPAQLRARTPAEFTGG